MAAGLEFDPDAQSLGSWCTADYVARGWEDTNPRAAPKPLIESVEGLQKAVNASSAAAAMSPPQPLANGEGTAPDKPSPSGKSGCCGGQGSFGPGNNPPRWGGRGGGQECPLRFIGIPAASQAAGTGRGKEGGKNNSDTSSDTRTREDRPTCRPVRQHEQENATTGRANNQEKATTTNRERETTLPKQ